MKSSHNIAAAVALGLLSIFPLATFQYSAADEESAVEPVYEAIATWPSEPRSVALQLVDAYGVPDEITADALMWHRTHPWEHTLVYRVDSLVPRTETVSNPRIEKTDEAAAAREQPPLQSGLVGTGS